MCVLCTNTIIPTLACMPKMEFMTLSTVYVLLWICGSVRRDWRNSRRWAHMKSSRANHQTGIKTCVGAGSVMDMVDVWLFRTRWFKVPFSSLAGGHLTPWKGHLIITKRSLWITRNTFFTAFLAVNHPCWRTRTSTSSIQRFKQCLRRRLKLFRTQKVAAIWAHREVTGWVFLSVWTWAIRLSKAWIFTEFIAYSEWSFVLFDFIL